MHILSAFQYCEDARAHFERVFRARSNTARMNRILKRSDGKRCTHNLCCESIWLGIGLVLRASHQSTFGLIVGVSQAYFYYQFASHFCNKNSRLTCVFKRWLPIFPETRILIPTMKSVSSLVSFSPILLLHSFGPMRTENLDRGLFLDRSIFYSYLDYLN
jgi:hypothetical protein